MVLSQCVYRGSRLCLREQEIGRWVVGQYSGWVTWVMGM